MADGRPRKAQNPTLRKVRLYADNLMYWTIDKPLSYVFLVGYWTASKIFRRKCENGQTGGSK